ncbi:hypothetical protein E2C01_047297 [Portunus trituberculatus]|uniref:Uncharacterized protein n=1 Tax=Portunus trituberculatus TaxID=210409 RepID=A0A5B7G8F7_PORTR|nr:hypothetical protein [Portunus trituberculatus]
MNGGSLSPAALIPAMTVVASLPEVAVTWEAFSPTGVAQFTPAGRGDQFTPVHAMYNNRLDIRH